MHKPLNTLDTNTIFIQGDWNESEGSDCEQSSDTNDESDEKKSKSSNTNVQPMQNYKKSTYILLDAKEKLNFTVTPAVLKLFNDMIIVYSSKTLSSSSRTSINVVNDIGPQSKVELFENTDYEDEDRKILICSKTYENEDSCPNSPIKSTFVVPGFSEDTNDDRDR